MRPRDLLTFLHRSIEIAVNRGHLKVSAEDILQAEKSYSEDIVLATAYEIADTYPKFSDLLYAFQGANKTLSKTDVEATIGKVGITEADTPKAIELLLWYGFMGASGRNADEEMYSYHVRYNLRHLLHPIESGEARL
jgi:hypothetical protein